MVRRRSGQGAKVKTLLLLLGDICHICEERMEKRVTRDHKIPYSMGGTSNISNYLLAHQSCNNARGDMALEELEMVKDAVAATIRDKSPFRSTLMYTLKRMKKNRELYGKGNINTGPETAPS